MFTWCHIIMCQIARYTISNYPYCRNIHNQIYGGAFAFSSSPWLITLYTSWKRGQNWDVTPSLLEYFLSVEEKSNCFFCPTRRWKGEAAGGVGTWARTNSPPQPPPLSNNYLTQQQQNNKEVDKGRWQNTTRWQHMGFSPIDQGLTSPTPYPLESCPFHFQICTAVAGCGLFYLMCMFTWFHTYNVPNSTTYHRQLSPLPKHTQPNRWWGLCL